MKKKKEINWVKILDDLYKRGWNPTSLGSNIGVDKLTIYGWHNKPDRIPSQRYAKKLLELWESQQTAPKRKKLQRSTAVYPTVDGARRRVRILRSLMDSYQMSLAEFAEILGVHIQTLRLYLDDKCMLIPSDEFLDRLRKVIENRDITYAGRFQALAKLIFGDYFEMGFGNRSLEKKEIIEKMGEITGLSRRTLYRLMPPYDNEFKPTRQVVRAFEKVAEVMKPDHNRYTKPN
jgi:transcriptional regulator with XRE-family HTH domain